MVDWRDQLSRTKVWARTNLNRDTLNELWQLTGDAMRGAISSSGATSNTNASIRAGKGSSTRTASLQNDRQYEEASQTARRRPEPCSHNGTIQSLPVLLTTPKTYLTRVAADTGSSLAASITSRIPIAHRSTARYYGRRALRHSSSGTRAQCLEEASFDPHCGTDDQTELSRTAMEYALPYRVVFNREEWVQFDDPDPQSEEYQAYKGRSFEQVRRQSRGVVRDESFFLDDLGDHGEAMSAEEDEDEDEAHAYVGFEYTKSNNINTRDQGNESLSHRRGKIPLHGGHSHS